SLRLATPARLPRRSRLTRRGGAALRHVGTVRYARAAGRLVYLVFPDGSLREGAAPAVVSAQRCSWYLRPARVLDAGRCLRGWCRRLRWPRPDRSEVLDLFLLGDALRDAARAVGLTREGARQLAARLATAVLALVQLPLGVAGPQQRHGATAED